MKNISKKDNPVPSLNKKDIKFLIELLEQNAPFGEKICFNKYGKLISKLENGVETNNEKPKSGHMTEISWGSIKHPDEYEGLNGDNTSYFRK